MSLHKLLSRFTGPLAMTHAGMASLLAWADRASEENSKQFAAKRLPRVNGQIAVIPVHGTLATFDDPWFGVSSMPRIGRMVDIAMASKEFKGIVFHVDSPGGTVAGTPELADKILGYRGQKPMIAIADTEAASAAYWIATAADQLVVTRSGEVGSVGVWTMHQDISQMMEKRGIDVTLISAGKYKVEGHPFGPLDNDAREEMQRSVDESYRDFLSTIAKHRGTTIETVRKDYGEGRMVGAKKAVEVGMADRVETFEGLLGALRAETKGSTRADRELAEELAAESVEPESSDEEAERLRDKDKAAQARAMMECT